MKFVGRENGFFWAVWSHASFAAGVCLDAGLSADVPTALQAIAAVPDVGRSRVALMDPGLAHATFAFIWLASPVLDPGTHAPEDQAYEVARSRQWNPPGPPPCEERAKPRSRAPSRREPCTSGMATTPYWGSVLGIDHPCTIEEVRMAFRAGLLTAHPDHGGTPEAFVRLKAAYDAALKEVSA